MNETQIFEALLDWNLWGNFDESLKNRELIPSPIKNVILVIKGIRRCGKSRLAYLIAKKYPPEKTLIINFEDPRLVDIKVNDIIKIVELYQKKVNNSLPELLILDEVQNIKGWEKIARFYSEAKKVKVIVTGSSSKLMSEEYSTVLTGRHIDFELFPLSFKETLYWSNINIKTNLDIYKNRIKILKIFEYYIKFGGFPAVFLLNNEKEKILLLREYFNDIILKDIVKRYKIRKIEKIENLAKIYISSISTLQSFNKLKNLANLSLDSIERFSKYFEIARLFLFIPKFAYSVKQQILSPKKVYCIDTGFYNALGFKFSENIGRLMENIVAIELLRRKSYYNPNIEVYYWKDEQQYEVDFLIKEGLRIKQLIQVTYASGFDEINPREWRALLRAYELFKSHNPELIIITWDYEDERKLSWFGKEGTIKFIPLWKWLLI